MSGSIFRPWRRLSQPVCFALLLGSFSLPTSPVLAQVNDAETAPAPVAALVQPGDPATSALRAYLESLRGKARTMGISDATMDEVFPGLTPNSRVIALDRTQPGGPPDSAPPPFAPYRASHVTERHIATGRSLRAVHAPQLAQLAAQDGISPEVLLAIFGHESDYGRHAGNFDILRSLATLAQEGRRRDLFEAEFLAALKILQSGVPRSQLVGSWAGAMGYPQFMPSVYLRVARDGNGDGRVDIWNSEADTLSSIAAYFRDSGWRAGQPWGIAVSVPDAFDRTTVASPLAPQRCARVHGRHSRWLSIGEWRQRGITAIDGKTADDTMLATLLEPDGPGRTAYLLTSNYRAILDYNCSNHYALSVGVLADAIAQ